MIGQRETGYLGRMRGDNWSLIGADYRARFCQFPTKTNKEMQQDPTICLRAVTARSLTERERERDRTTKRERERESRIHPLKM